jgi:Rrf2 family nitric oxide-sensitive transcriptional repressor
VRLQKNTLAAIYSVLEFAANPGRTLSAAEIAREYRISPHHLSKVLRALGRAGLLESERGVGGGYRFVGNPKRLTLMDVIGLFEEISAPRRGGRRPARREAASGAAPVEVEDAVAVVLAEIDEIAKATFRSITLATMLKLVARRRK